MAPFGPRSTEPSDAQNHERIAHDGHGDGHGSSLGAIPSALRHVNDEPLPDPLEITAAQKMLSATSGSLLTGLLVTPLDVVRVRWQSQSISTVAPAPLPADFQRLALSTPSAFRPSNLGVTACCREVFFMNNTTEACLAGPRIGPGIVHNSGGVECAVEQTRQRAFTSTIDGLRKIARNEGLTTLWRGLSPTLIMAVPANIIYFTGYDWLRYNTRSPIQRAAVRDEYAPLVGGALSRVLAATAVGPIELFRTRMQASSSGSSTGNHLADTFRDIKQMVGLQGYSALWRGLTLTLWRDVPFSGMYWWGYEMIRGKLTDAREPSKRASSDPLDLDVASNTTISRQARSRARRNSQSRENHAETFTDSFIAGALSGAFASVATMPFDVGKTRTQVFRDTGSAAAAAVPEERSMARLLWHIFSTEGAAGLFKGWIPRTLKVAPACAIMISSYEVGKRAFRGVNERSLLKNEREP
ncbi:mitochondrial carrier domain-containing protein [Lasiosphaeria miniovina]|uniref:Mitochondrial carrier domain-containing protein n=1 Tax=Lasiosphaeria miniovina TaxID=1954250 RepID=A0AA40EEF0_9PEZI|nr:mitochondrial carrier domain-containing protein [Lasiosphaeria miniovina]KAK0734421.1 mitochondrial carrier domain-containing protein [Lasiosphaeria miniovina]